MACRHLLQRPNHVDPQVICKKSMEAGLTDIRSGRKDSERIEHYDHVIDCAEPGSELIIIGRSLKDWASRWTSLKTAIKTKGIHVKLGLLDENSLPDKTLEPNDEKNRSWIEKPIPSDWAINDVHNSMKIFRDIELPENCKGSLEIYGLPFYVSHSFVAYTNQYDQRRYCAEEAGMALHKNERPFLEVEEILSQPQSWAKGIEKIYRSMLIPERLLLAVRDSQREERDTTKRSKIIEFKVEKLGLVDLAIGRDNIDWEKPILHQIITTSPEGGEIFMVGRSLVSLFNHELLIDIVNAVKQKRLRCNLVMANPNMGNLSSLVEGDYAMDDLRREWPGRCSQLKSLLPINPEQESGYLEIFGIAGYVPVTFASFCLQLDGDTIRYCTLEPGISVKPWERPVLVFKETCNGCSRRQIG